MTCSVERLTPAGAGGVAVVALRGPGAAERLARLTPVLPAVGELRLARLLLDGELLDEALVVRTAEQHLELGLHGGPGLVEEVLAALGSGPPPAATSVEELALERLAVAPCDRAARVLLDQARGALRGAAPPEGGWVAAWRRQRHLLEPATVVLAGPVNAGKSTLFNLLVGEDRVTVSAEEGTTRDAVVARARVGHHAIDLVDTAGERALPGGGGAAEVEARGQALAASLRARADLVLWLAPDGEEPPPGDPVVTLRSRADAGPPDTLSSTARPAESLALVHRVIAEALGLPEGDPWTPGAPVPPSLAIAEALDAEEHWGSPCSPRRGWDSALGRDPALPLP